MNWLSVTLTVALTATTWLGWSDQIPATTVETTLIDPSESVDLPPVVRTAQAANAPGDDLNYFLYEIWPCADQCPGLLLDYPDAPVVDHMVDPNGPASVHGAAQPYHYEVDENWNETIYIRVGEAEFFAWFYEDIRLADWTWQYTMYGLKDYTLVWEPAENVVVSDQGKRLTFNEAGDYTLGVKVVASYWMDVSAMLTCQNCYEGCHEWTTTFDDIPLPEHEQDVRVTVVKVGSLTLADAGSTIEDEIVEPWVADRTAHLRARSTDPAMIEATAAPFPEVGDEVLNSLGWSFGGGQEVAGQSPYRKRRISAQTAAITPFFVEFYPTSKKRVVYNVGLDMSPSPTAPPEVLIGSRATPSASLVPAGARFLLELGEEAVKPTWSIPNGWYVKDYIAYGYLDTPPAGYEGEALGKVIEMAAEDLVGDSIAFFWVDAGPRTVRASLNVAGVALQGETGYTVHAPTLGDDQGGDLLKTWGFDGVNLERRDSILGKYVYIDYGGELGITVNWPKDKNGREIQGVADWIQLVKNQVISTRGTVNTISDDYPKFTLDDRVPYGNPGTEDPVIGTASMRDIPGVPIGRLNLSNLIKFERSFVADSRLMVRPAGGIWVPAGKKVMWSFRACAEKDPQYDPNGGGEVADAWNLVYGRGKTRVHKPKLMNNMEFPTWTAVVRSP